MREARGRESVLLAVEAAGEIYPTGASLAPGKLVNAFEGRV